MRKIIIKEIPLISGKSTLHIEEKKEWYSTKILTIDIDQEINKLKSKISKDENIDEKSIIINFSKELSLITELKAFLCFELKYKKKGGAIY